MYMVPNESQRFERTVPFRLSFFIKGNPRHDVLTLLNDVNKKGYFGTRGCVSGTNFEKEGRMDE